MKAYTVCLLALLSAYRHPGRGGDHCHDENDDVCSWECRKECKLPTTTTPKPPSECSCTVLRGGTSVAGDLFVAGEVIASSAEISGTITSTNIVNSGEISTGSVETGSIITGTISTSSLIVNGVPCSCSETAPNGGTVVGNLTVTDEIIAHSAEISGTITSTNIVNSGEITSGSVETGSLTAATGISTPSLTVGGMECACSGSVLGGNTVSGNLAVSGEIIASSAEISGTITSITIANSGEITSGSVETGSLTATTGISTPSLTVDGYTCSCSGASLGGGQYGYIYNDVPETVAIEATVPFSSNGPLSAGILHAAGSDSVTVVDAGTYEVTFSVSGAEPSEFALFVNGVVVPGSIYGSGAGTQQNNGQVIVVLSAASVLTLKNHSSSAAVTLAESIGGSQTTVVNASILIKQLA